MNNKPQWDKNRLSTFMVITICSMVFGLSILNSTAHISKTKTFSYFNLILQLLSYIFFGDSGAFICFIYNKEYKTLIKVC